MDLGSLEEWEDHFGWGSRRYLAVNPTQLFGGYGTVEVRMHSGTIEAPKILTWLSLWMRIHEAAADSERYLGSPLVRVRTRPLCAGPRGDVRDLAKFVGAGEAVAAKLARRRSYVMENSWCAHPQFGALARRLLAHWSE
jgi:hypothetical protein